MSLSRKNPYFKQTAEFVNGKEIFLVKKESCLSTMQWHTCFSSQNGGCIYQKPLKTYLALVLFNCKKISVFQMI